jgi:GNAT superfamily N-acetyltransferase
MLVQTLDDRHDRKGFDCGEIELNNWLSRFAKQHKEKGLSSTFVIVDTESSSEILGFYAVSPTELLCSALPSNLQKRLPNKAPSFRLGRLATANAHKGKGIGALLLFDAINRVTRISADIGGVGLVVNAKPNAIGFYAQYGFEQMSDHPNNLFLPLY